MQRLVSCSLPGKQTDTFGCKDRSVSGFVSGPADTRPVCSAKTRVTLAAKSCREEAAADRERAEEVGMFTGETTAYKILYQNRKKQRQPIVGRVGGSCKRTRVWFIATQILFKGCFMMFCTNVIRISRTKRNKRHNSDYFLRLSSSIKLFLAFSPKFIFAEVLRKLADILSRLDPTCPQSFSADPSVLWLGAENSRWSLVQELPTLNVSILQQEPRLYTGLEADSTCNGSASVYNNIRTITKPARVRWSPITWASPA